MNLTLIFEGLEKKELESLRKANLNQIKKKAFLIQKERSSCLICKKPIKDFLDLRWIRKKQIISESTPGNFCSIDCLKKYLNTPKKIHPPNNLNPQTIISSSLALFLQKSEIETLTRENFLKELEKCINNYNHRDKCNFCHRELPQPSLMVEIYQSSPNHLHRLDGGEFCSKGCLKKYIVGGRK